MPRKILYPVSSLFKEVFPSDVLSAIDSALDKLAVDPSATRFDWTDRSLGIYFRLVVLERIGFDLPFIPGFSLHLGRSSTYLQFDLGFESDPSPRVYVQRIELTIHAPSSMLQQYEQVEDGVWRPQAEVEGYDFTWETGLTADFDGKLDLHAPELVGLPPFMIGDTGFIVDFSREGDSDAAADVVFVNAQPPERIRDRVPFQFNGLFIERAGIHYYKPDSGTRLPRIGVDGAAVGTGGFSGGVLLGDEREEPAISEERLSAEDFNPSELSGDHILGFELAGMQVVLWHMRLSFEQSIPVGFLLTGLVQMPFVDRWMKVKASLGGPDGDFMMEVGGVGESGLIDLNHDWFEIIVNSIRYELRDPIHYAIINGSLKPKIGGFDWPTFEVDRLAIGSDGSVDIDGGWIDVPESFVLDFHGFKIDISQIGMGTEGEAEAARQWVGFSGGITLIEGIPLSASVEGLKISWRTSGDPAIKVGLEGIALHLEIPNTLILDGSVRYREIPPPPAERPADRAPEAGEETSAAASSRTFGHVFTGSVMLNITALNTSVSGELLIGDLTQYSYDSNRNLVIGEKFTAFYIVLNAQLPTALPLGATGTGLYGLQGLFGMHVAPDRQSLAGGEPKSWYLWYKEPKAGVEGSAYNVTKVPKWAPRFDNYAFGAGLTLGTIYDDGFTINFGALVVILIPGPVIMIEGRANLLKQRGEGGGKNAEGALYALIVFDGLAETF